MTHFRLFQTERVCRRHFCFDEYGRNFSERIGNTVGIGEIAHNEQFLFFPQCFQRLVLQTCKNKGLFGKVLKEKYILLKQVSKNIQFCYSNQIILEISFIHA